MRPAVGKAEKNSGSWRRTLFWRHRHNPHKKERREKIPEPGPSPPGYTPVYSPSFLKWKPRKGEKKKRRSIRLEFSLTKKGD